MTKTAENVTSMERRKASKNYLFMFSGADNVVFPSRGIGKKITTLIAKMVYKVWIKLT